MCGTKEKVLRCSKCKMTHYCSKKCQKLHFDHHYPYCTMIEGLKEVERRKIYGDLSVRQIQINDKTRNKQAGSGPARVEKMNLETKKFGDRSKMGLKIF